ncbi:MAG: hypothetical protein IJ242_13855 [Clostridia bacterium]|nr:hypothetical protein [Clostridia bacterium]
MKDECEFDGEAFEETDEAHPGMKKIPVLISINDLIASRYKSVLLTGVNHAIRNGALDDVTESGIPAEPAENDIHILDFSYYRKGRMQAECDARIWMTLTVQSENGVKTEVEADLGMTLWLDFSHSVLECEFLDAWDLDFAPERKGEWKMDEYGVPFIPASMREPRAEDIWHHYMECGLFDAQSRSGVMLAIEQGMDIIRMEGGADPYISFGEKDRLILSTEGDNELAVFRQCIHYEWHRIFFAVQGMDTSRFETIRKEWVSADTKVNESLWIALNQASRGAYSLLMPEAFVKNFVKHHSDGAAKVKRFFGYHNHPAAVLEAMAEAMGKEYTEYRGSWIKARFIQVVDAAARGMMNWTDGHMIDAFDFLDESLKSGNYSLAIGPRYRAISLFYRDTLFREVMESGNYVYADGLIAGSHPDYVMETERGLRLTPLSNLQADACCLRFTTKWNSRYKGWSFRFGKENYELVRTEKNGEGSEARKAQLYRLGAFATVHEMIADLVRARSSVPEASMRSCIPADRIEYLMDTEQSAYFRDEMTALCIGLRLEPQVSFMLLEKAGIDISVQKEADPGMRRAMLCLFRLDTVSNLQLYLQNEKQNKLGIMPLDLFEWRRQRSA